MNSDVLPSGRFVKTVATLIVVTVFFFIVKSYGPAALDYVKTRWEAVRNPAINMAGIKNFEQFKKLDSDRDGLLDWEESLYGTNPNKFSSDDSGVSDSVRMRGTDASSDPNDTEPAEKLTVTDIVARDLYSSISIIKQQNGVVTDADNEKLAEITTKASAVTKPSSITMDQLNIVASNAVNTKKFSAQFKKSAQPISASMVSPLLLALDNDAVLPSKSVAAIDAEFLHITAMLSIPVPKSSSEAYLAYVNTYRDYIYILSLIAHADTDPLPALGAVQILDVTLDAFSNAAEILEKSIS